MSDCSSNAMKPKEKPKTCGTCFHCAERHGTRFIKRDGVCLYCGEAVDTQSTSPICPCGNHRMWRERAGTLEQRYQQLEQVARRLYGYIKRDADDSWSPVKEKIAQQFRKQLEALGVDIDD